MKTKILLFFLLAISSVKLQGQEITILFSEEQSFQNEVVCVSVSADTFQNMGSLQFGITWDADILQFNETVLHGLDSPNGNAVFNEISENQLLFSWFTSNSEGLSLPLNALLFDLCFTAIGPIGSNSSISVSTENINPEGGQFNDGTPQLIPLQFDEGNVEIISFPDFEIITNAISCNGAANGSFSISVLPSNDFNYNVLFNEINYSLMDFLLIENILSGSYPLSISYGENIILDTILLIDDNDFIPFEIVPIASFNCSENTGTIELQIVEGSEPYNFQWEHDSDLNSNQAENLSEGLYAVTITDNDGCISDTIVSVQAIFPEVDLGENANFCAGEAVFLNGSTTVDAYLWNTGETTPQIEVSESGDYVLTVTDTNMCSATDTIQINFTPTIQAIINGPDSICSDIATFYTATGGESYIWLDEDGTFLSNEDFFTLSTNENTTFSLVAENECFADTLTQEVFIYQNEVEFPDDTLVLTDFPLTLTATGGVDYLWTGNFDYSCTDCDEVTFNPDASNFAFLQITDTNNCEIMDSIFIEVTDNVIILFDPVNIITPNGDNKNDRLVFEGLEIYPNNELKVFNRWGNIVYETISYQNDWGGTHQGKPLPAGNYYYVLTVNKTEQNLKSILTISNQ